MIIQDLTPKVLTPLKEGIMLSKGLSSVCYSHWTITGLAVLVFLVITPAHAQEPSLACKLLQPAELESALKEWALGGKAGKSSGATAVTPNMSLDTCHTEIVRPGHGNLQVNVHIVKNLPEDGGGFIRRRNGDLSRQGQWKVMGAQFEQKTVGNAMCTMAGRPNVAATTVCSIPRGKGYVEVEVIAPTQKEMASVDAVGALVQKANSRL
jgi:hypothetical protein